MQLNLVLFNFLRETENSVDIASTNEYLYQIYMPVMIWLVLVLILIIILFKKFTLRDWAKEGIENPYEGESLGMPRGTFRSILTLTLLFVSVILELVSVHTPGFEENVGEFLVAFQMMIAFYFGSKVMHHITSTDKHKAQFAVEENIEIKKVIHGMVANEQVVDTSKTEVDTKVESLPKLEEMYDDGNDEGVDDDSDNFDEEAEFGGADPDAQG